MHEEGFSVGKHVVLFLLHDLLYVGMIVSLPSAGAVVCRKIVSTDDGRI